METLKLMWKWIVGVLGTIVGLIMLKDFFQSDLKANAKNADTTLKSAVDDTKLQANAQAQSDVENSTKSLQGDLNKAKADAANQTVDQVQDFWKKS